VIHRGIFWGIIISIPFWLLAIWLVKSGIIALKTFFIVVLIFSAPYIYLIIRPPQNAEQDKQEYDFDKDGPDDDPTASIQSSKYPHDPSDSGTPG